MFGPDHPHTISALGELATVYCNCGEDEKAETIFRELVEAKQRTLGSEHPETLVSMHRLSVSLIHLDRLDEAERLLRQTVELQLAVQ